MGLDIALGYLVNSQETDNESAEWNRRQLNAINKLLVANKLPPHVEPKSHPELEDRCCLRGMPYSWIHYLRRAYAYAKQAPSEFRPVQDQETDLDDPLVDREADRLESHLICHADSGGFYVPVDFAEPLIDDTDAVVGAVLGSSQAAMRELIFVAPLIGIALYDDQLSDQVAEVIAHEDSGPLYIERQVWLQLYEAFRLSIEHKTAVAFC